MSVYYLIIADKPSNKILGEYCDVSQGGSIQEFNTVKAKGQELFASTTETQTQNSSTELTNFTLYYILTSSNTFYYVAVNKKLQEVVKSNMIFELIEDLEHQGIKLQVDKVNEGQFSSVGQQNLKFTIDKYITSQITKGEPSNRVNTLRSETEANIVTTQTNEPIDAKQILSDAYNFSVENIWNNRNRNITACSRYYVLHNYCSMHYTILKTVDS